MKVLEGKSFGDTYAEIAKQWHPTKNNDLTPYHVLPGSDKKVWWRCEHGHEWTASIKNRKQGRGCPYCSGNRLTLERSLGYKYPVIAEEWHRSKNENLSPFEVFSNSTKKYWWLCKKGHEWQTTPNLRTTNGNNCPYCCNQKVNHENCLLTINPDLAKEWNEEKNGNLKPTDVIAGSERKVWWVCEKEHEWKARATDRNKGNKCPFCTNHKACKDNCLATVNPELVKEWHPTKNKDITPEDVLPNSRNNVWWLCSNGHEWKNKIQTRNRGAACPYCSNRIACIENSLSSLYPEVAEEWHESKNKNVTPNDVTYLSCQKFWWSCRKGHEWRTTVNHRTVRGQGCPTCNSESSTSFAEQSVYYYISNIFHDAINRHYINKSEIDIFIPCLNLGIEYDGMYYHKNKKENDERKSKKLTEQGIKLIRIRERKGDKRLPELSSNDIQIENDLENKNHLNFVVYQIFSYIINNYKLEAETKNNILHQQKIIDIHSDRISIQEQFIQNEKKNSLLLISPEIAKEWHPFKNGALKPEFFSNHSRKKVWWKCEKNHEWETSISHRTRDGNGCPYCAGRLASVENNLLIANEKLASQWHPTKNGTSQPSDFLPFSEKKVWWLCDSGHEWKAPIFSRNRGSRCPYCSGRKATKETSLGYLYPEVALEWHPTKNNGVTPFEIRPGSSKKVWWQCKEGHEWEISLVSRTGKKNGCPFCSGRKATQNICLATKYPVVVPFWNYEKNGNETPLTIPSGSNRKMWWKCSKGHEWHLSVANMKKRKNAA